MLANQILLLIDKDIQLNHAHFKETFDKEKNDLAEFSDEIGGNTFELTLKFLFRYHIYSYFNKTILFVCIKSPACSL